MHLVLQDQLLGLGHGGVGLALLVLDDEFHLRPAERAALVLVEVHLEAADLGEDARDRRVEANSQLFLRAGGDGGHGEGHAAAHECHP